MESFDPASTEHIAAFSCSPRARGNSDKAMELFVSAVRKAGGKAHRIYLRQYDVLPCLGCCRCAHDRGRRCFQAKMDQSAPLFQTLLSAPRFFFAAPIYFYHLPSMFKAFIDRGQRFYLRREDDDAELLALPRRLAHVALMAGRARGDKLFEGSLLTLRYFLRPFNIELAEPLLFPGMDGPKDLLQSPEARDRILALAQAVAGPIDA